MRSERTERSWPWSSKGEGRKAAAGRSAPQLSQDETPCTQRYVEAEPAFPAQPRRSASSSRSGDCHVQSG
jgi:hypothetical protein